MSNDSRRRYDSTFKEEAVKLVLRGRSLKQVAKDLGIHDGMLSRWKREYLKDNNAFPGTGNLKPEDQRVRDLEKRLRDAEEERDILKKALAIFSKTPR